MLDIKFIKENQERIKKAAVCKNVKIDIEKIIVLDDKRRSILTKIDKVRAERNELAKSGQSARPSDEQIEKGKKIKQELSGLEQELNSIESDYNTLILKVPNIFSDDTPIGKDENENQVIRKYKEPTRFEFEPRDHMELGLLNGLIDTEKASRIAGARFNYLFGPAVLLQFAIIQFVMDTLTNRDIIKELAKKAGNPFDKPFIPVIPPVMAKSEIMKKMDRFDPIEDRYYLREDDVLLVGSAEHTLGPLHMDEIIDEKNLPIRYIGYSTAFRREAGSYGKDTSGILRRHQFDKAEMETFASEEYGRSEQDLIVAIQEYLVTRLDIPHRVVAICTGDMGKPDFRQIDIECWMPGQNKYRETHTSDYMTDFQARRLNIKYKSGNNTKKYVHMNDATAFAMGRILIAILENFQQQDGSVMVPEVLRKYMPGNIEKIENKI